MLIRKAERKKAKLRIGLSGAPGAGKTYSSLLLAKGIGTKIGLIDTESGRGDLYSNDFDYDIISLEKPYTVDRYIQAITMLEQGGYDVIIIDSLSHAWVGDGGVLSVADKMQTNNNKFTGWKHATPQQNALIDKIISCKAHLIMTLRSQIEWALQPNEKGKMVPHKIGLKPVQRDGIEYEFTVHMEMQALNEENVAFVSKDATRLYYHETIKPTALIGKALLDWVNEGRDEIKLDPIITITHEISKCEGIDRLNETYRALVAQHPELKEQIIVRAKEHKEKLNGSVFQ